MTIAFFLTHSTKVCLLLVYLELLVIIVFPAAITDPLRPLLRQRERQVDVEFLGEELIDGASIAQIHPVTNGGVLLLVLALSVDDVIVALGA